MNDGLRFPSLKKNSKIELGADCSLRGKLVASPVWTQKPPILSLETTDKSPENHRTLQTFIIMNRRKNENTTERLGRNSVASQSRHIEHYKEKMNRQNGMRKANSCLALS